MIRKHLIAQAAGKLAIRVDWLRDAERRGRIPPARRDANGWRVYVDGDLPWVRHLLGLGGLTTETRVDKHLLQQVILSQKESYGEVGHLPNE